jgi:hypothetical protein
MTDVRRVWFMVELLGLIPFYLCCLYFIYVLPNLTKSACLLFFVAFSPFWQSCLQVLLRCTSLARFGKIWQDVEAKDWTCSHKLFKKNWNENRDPNVHARRVRHNCEVFAKKKKGRNKGYKNKMTKWIDKEICESLIGALFWDLFRVVEPLESIGGNLTRCTT